MPERVSLPERNPLLRSPYDGELHAAELELGQDYAEWLEAQGLDPTCAEMTDDGLTLFNTLLDAQNTRNRIKRPNPPA